MAETSDDERGDLLDEAIEAAESDPVLDDLLDEADSAPEVRTATGDELTSAQKLERVRKARQQLERRATEIRRSLGVSGTTDAEEGDG
jgi:hypothetical protein